MLNPATLRVKPGPSENASGRWTGSLIFANAVTRSILTSNVARIPVSLALIPLSDESLKPRSASFAETAMVSSSLPSLNEVLARPINGPLIEIGEEDWLRLALSVDELMSLLELVTVKLPKPRTPLIDAVALPDGVAVQVFAMAMSTSPAAKSTVGSSVAERKYR